MSASARLVTTLAGPLESATASLPGERCLPGRTLILQGDDTQLAAYDLAAALAGEASVARFPRPWPRRFGTCTVSPGLDVAVFAGVHAVRAVDRRGTTLWEVRHGCWEGSCREMHASFDEYGENTDSRGHLYADSGSVVFSADGKLVWAHVRGPLAAGDEDPDVIDEWLVLDATDGRVLGQADIQTAAAGSGHVSHPDPGQMGLSVGEGQDGVPLLWGRWDGERLTVDRIGDDDRCLMAVSPSGEHFLTVTHYQEALALHRVEDGSVVSELDAEEVIPDHPALHPDNDEPEVRWDYYGGFLDEHTVIAGTSEADEEYGAGRHWLVDVRDMRLLGEVTYPFPTSGVPGTLGDGSWYTIAEDTKELQVWRLAGI
ncbi:hypothetical protein [Streptomyces sp. NBC_00268]|jgi:hypothetical protein|uniref:hypothetical protein n=1 Tax=unclassified Streptomyces TaxID=2593676 RepID=UPI002257DBC3|nr:hypothetical protein [Streptomyces sp. NBC_00268]MCX5184513.1 hypothetical protein [Streptomyces sp. NBC_00268]